MEIKKNCVNWYLIFVSVFSTNHSRSLGLIVKSRDTVWGKEEINMLQWIFQSWQLHWFYRWLNEWLFDFLTSAGYSRCRFSMDERPWNYVSTLCITYLNVRFCVLHQYVVCHCSAMCKCIQNGMMHRMISDCSWEIDYFHIFNRSFEIEHLLKSEQKID